MWHINYTCLKIMREDVSVEDDVALHSPGFRQMTDLAHAPCLQRSRRFLPIIEEAGVCLTHMQQLRLSS